MQGESAAEAHLNTSIIFRRQIRLLVFINNNAWGHQVSGSRDHVKEEIQLQVCYITGRIYTVF